MKTSLIKLMTSALVAFSLTSISIDSFASTDLKACLVDNGQSTAVTGTVYNQQEIAKKYPQKYLLADAYSSYYEFTLPDGKQHVITINKENVKAGDSYTVVGPNKQNIKLTFSDCK